MKRRKPLVALCALATAGALLFHSSAPLMGVVRRAAALSAALQLADGLLGVWGSAPASDGGVSQAASSAAAESTAKTASTATDEVETSSAPAAPPKGVETGKVQTATLSLTAANTSGGGVHVSNKTDVKLNLAELLSKGLPFPVNKTNSSSPQVLIVHTHATEAFADADAGYYVKSASTRSTDVEKNVVRVGRAIAETLKAAGIATLHDQTLHDSPNYTRSAETIRRYLQEYPSIRVVIDAHRDAIDKDDDTKIKPTATVQGKKAAQVMILAGCETGSVEGFPNWEQNLRVCLLLQRRLEADYPGLARPLLFKACKYNFDLLPGSMLIEIGTDANTLAEAVYSGELLATALAKVLKE